MLLNYANCSLATCLDHLFSLIEVCSVDLLVACERVGTAFIGDVLRETHLAEDPGRTDKIDLMTRKQKKHRLPPPEGNLLENSSGLKKKNPSRNGRDRSPIKTRKAISTTEILPLWPPFLSAKPLSSSLTQGSAWSQIPKQLKSVPATVGN